jgi:hypothetical protein
MTYAQLLNGWSFIFTAAKGLAMMCQVKAG